jgi:phosphatidylglycerophosphate synthase
MVEQKKDFGFKNGQNSPLRMRTASIFQKTAEKVNEKVPHLTPNTVTLIGTATVLTAGYLQEKENRKKNPRKWVKAVAGVVKGAGYSLDGLDGALARQINKITPGTINTSSGAVNDLINDRAQEAGLASMRAVSAHERGSKIGVAAARLFEVTSIIPSAVRARLNKNGETPDEVGNFGAFLGSRPGRMILGEIGSAFPRVQPFTDTIGTGANGYAIYYRLVSTGNGLLSESDRATAAKAEKALVLGEVAAVAHVLYKAAS